MRLYQVVIMGTEFYDGREHRYCNYPVTDVLQMMGRSVVRYGLRASSYAAPSTERRAYAGTSAGRQAQDPIGKAVILCHTPKKEFYKKFLHEPVPVERYLQPYAMSDPDLGRQIRGSKPCPWYKLCGDCDYVCFDCAVWIVNAVFCGTGIVRGALSSRDARD